MYIKNKLNMKDLTEKECDLSFDALSDKVVNVLNGKIGPAKCPMCQHMDFTIINGFFLPVVQERVGEIKFGTNSVPMVGIVCGNCGYISFHSVGSLGLLPSIKHDKSDEVK